MRKEPLFTERVTSVHGDMVDREKTPSGIQAAIFSGGKWLQLLCPPSGSKVSEGNFELGISASDMGREFRLVDPVANAIIVLMQEDLVISQDQ